MKIPQSIPLMIAGLMPGVRLKQFFTCDGGCSVSAGADQPAEVVDDAPPHQVSRRVEVGAQAAPPSLPAYPGLRRILWPSGKVHIVRNILKAAPFLEKIIVGLSGAFSPLGSNCDMFQKLLDLDMI